MDNAQWKKFQFVTEVQTALFANALATHANAGSGSRPIFSSASTALTEINEVFQAAEKIPDDVSAHDAAVDYVKDLLENAFEDELDFSQLHLTS